MAVFSYVGGSVSMATGSYGNLSIRKGTQVAVPNTITTSARSFVEGTPTSGLFNPVDRTQLYSRIAHGSGYNATKINFNTTEPYNSGAYPSRSYYTPYTTVFQDLDYSQYNTQTSSGEYWAHAQGYVNSEFGTAIAVDKNRNAWVVGSTDYCNCTITSITNSLTPVGSFTNSTTVPNSGTNDSGYFLLSIPLFNHNIFGLNSNVVVVHTNSWVSFQPLINTTLATFSGTTPAWANVQIAAGDTSCQRVYYGTFGGTLGIPRTYRIRFEGTDAPTGILGSPRMVWEIIFYQDDPNVFDIQIGTLNRPSPRFSGISDGSNYFGTFDPSSNTGWRFTTNNVVAGASGNNITLVKYSTKGQFHQDKDFFPYTSNDDLAVLSIGRNGNDVGEAVKIGKDGRIYILYTSNSEGYVSGVANNDLGIIKLDPEFLYKSSGAANAVVWNKSFGTTSNDSAQSFDIDSDDNLYITGFTVGSGQGNNDVIVIKVDKLGNVLWKKTYGASTGGDLGNAIKISPDGNSLYIWGYSGSTPLIGSTDWFLLKVNSSNGSIVWQKHFNIGATTGGQVFENSIDVDPDGNVYVTGFSATTPQAYFVAKLDPSGNFKWSRNVGALSGNPDAGTSIKYKKGFVYVGGQDSSTFNNSESYGLGVSKLDADTGQLISNYVVGGVNVEYAYAIDVDDYGDIYATGAVNTTLPGLTSASGANAFTTKFILDTPLGGFTISGDAGVWSSTTAKRYRTSNQSFTAQDIAFQDDLIATGQQFIFVGTTTEAKTTFEKEFTFTGSGSISSSNVNVSGIVSFKGGVGTPSTQLFTLSGTPSVSYVNPYNKPVQTYRGSSDLSLLSGYEVAFDPDLYTGKVQYKIYDSNLYSTEKFEKEFRFTTSGVLSSSISISIQISTRSNTYSTPLEVYTRSNKTYYPSNILLSRSGNRTLSTSSYNGYFGSAKVTFNPAEDTQLFSVSGQHGTRVFVPNFAASGSVNFTGVATYKETSSWIGSSPVEYYTPSQVAFGDGEIYRASEFKADATAFYRFQKGAFAASGTIAATNEGLNSRTVVAFIPLNTILIYNTNVFTKIAMQYAGKSPTTPFGGLDIIFEELEPNAPPQQFKYTGAASEPIRTFRWVATPSAITTSGTAVEKFTDAYVVSGSLTTGFEAGAKVTFRPFDAVDSDPLFSIIGQHGTRVFVPNWIASGNTATSGSLSNLKRSSSWVGSSPIQYFDPQEVVFEDNENFKASEFKYESTSRYRFQKGTFSGSGSIVGDPNASAAVVFNPPDEAAAIQLFSISGAYSNLRFTKINSEASGNISITGAATPPSTKYIWSGASPIEYYSPSQIVFGEGENFRASEFKYGSTSLYKFQKGTFSGSGSIVGDPNASAAVVFNPPDESASVQLFSISGAYSNLRFTKTLIFEASSLFAGASGSAAVSFNPPDTDVNLQQLFGINGSLVEKYTKGLYTGDGYINSSNFGSAKVTFRPFDAVDTDSLFSVVGQHGTRVFVPNWIASGSSSTSNQASYKTTSYWIGYSPIEYFDSYQIVFEDGENFRASEFKYDSTGLYKFIKSPYAGSGTISSGLFGTAAVVFNPPDESAGIQLFNVSGAYSNLGFIKKVLPDASPLTISISGAASNEKHVDTTVGSGLLSVTGALVERQTDSIFASGSLFAASGAAEAFGVNPVDTTQLFDISGSAIANRTIDLPAFGGSINITGAATEPTKQFKWVGSSPITYFNPDDIVFGNEENGIPDEYKYASTAAYKSQFRDSGSGSLSISGNTLELFKVGPWVSTGIINVSGSYSNLQFISQGGEAPVLFQVNGAALSSIHYEWIGSSPFTYFSAGQIVFEDGENFNNTTFKYESSGSYRFQNATFSGSGSIASDNLGSATVTFNPPDTAAAIQLFSISGQHATREFVPSWPGSGSTTLSGSGSQSIKYANFTGNSPSAYIDPYEVVFGEEENYGSTDISLSGYSKFSATPRGEVGSGALFTDGFFSNLKAIFRPFDATDSEQLFSINGQHGTRVFVPNWIATGSISTGFEGSVKVTFNPPEFDPLFTTSGGAVDKHIDVASGSGNLFTASGGAQKVTFRPVDATDTDFLFSISGSAGVKLRDYVWVSAVVEYDPYEYVINDEFIIPDFIKIKTTFEWDNVNNIYRSLSTESITVDQDASGSASVVGNVGTRTFVPNWRGSGSVSVTGAATEKHIDAASGSGNLFAASGASQSVGANPPDDTALFVVSGTVVEKHIDRTSGSGTTTVTGTAIESHTDVTAGSGEAVFGDGSATVQIIRYNVFGGIISFSESATASVTFNPPEADPLFTLSGAATESQTDITSGSGSIATDISAVSRVIFNPADTEQLFEVTGAYSDLKFTSDYNASGTITVDGTVVEKHVDVATGSGTTTFTGAATESQTDIAVPGTGTIEFSGEALDEYASGGLRGSGTLFIIEGGAERVTFNPPEGNQLFDVSGSFNDIKITSDYEASGSATLEGTLGSRIFVPNWIGSGTITVTGESTQSHVDITSGSGALFTGGFYSNLKATFRSVSDVGLFDVTGTLVEKHIDAATGSGSATFTGTATESQTEITSGSGTLFSGGLYSDLRVTFNPSEEPALFTVTGSATEKQTDREIGSGSIAITGTVVEKHIDIASGSGSIAAGFNASASVTFRPFDATDTDSLFSILGSAIEKNTESYVGSGSATFSGTAAESQRNITSGSGALFTDGFFSNLKATFRPFDATDLDPLFSIDGSAVEKNTESYDGSGSGVFDGTVVEKHINITSGSGNLFSASGAAEATGVNPPEDTALFTIDGAATQRYFATNIGSGSIFTSFGGTASVAFNPPEDTQLFDVSGSYSDLKATSAYVGSGSSTFSGTVVEKFADSFVGSGTATFSGTVVEKHIDVTSGSGTLFSASGASQSVGANPPEDTALFAVSGTYSNLKFISANTVSGSATFSGTVTEKFSDAFVGSGTATFSGTVVEKHIDIALPGSGSLFTASGASQSVGANPPEDTALFSVSGAYSNLKYTSAWVGTGTLFAVSGAAQSITFNPPEDTQLFVITGAVSQAQRNVALPGSGSLFTAFGGTASVTFNPPEDTQLFNVSGAYSDLRFTSRNIGSGSATFSGSAAEKFVSRNIVSGSTSLSGTLVEKHVDVTSGSGSLFTAFGGTASVTFNPPEDTQLFDVSGSYSDLKATSAYVGSGSLFAFSGAVVVAAISEVGTGLFDISDTAIESTTNKTIDGSGSLFGFSGGVESVTFNPVENTQLFEVSGSVFVRTAFGYGGGTLDISGSGEAIFRRALVPQRGSGEIVSSGESFNKKIFSPFVGSGSLFAASGSAQATTNVPPIDSIIWEDDLRTTLYLIGGSASVSRAVTIDNDITINTNGSSIVRTLLPEKIFATII